MQHRNDHHKQRILSIFDSLGPVMTGPSSSHTAGMARIGRMAHYLVGGTPQAITLSFFNALSQTYKGHASDSAVVAGLLGEHEASPVIASALAVAQQKNIAVTCITNPQSEKNPNTVVMILQKDKKTFVIEGISVGGGEFVIVSVDGYPVGLRGSEDGLFIVGNRLDKDEIQKCAVTHGLDCQEGATPDVVYCYGDQMPTTAAIDEFAKLNGVTRVYPFARILLTKPLKTTALFSTFSGLQAQSYEYGSLLKAIEQYEMQRSGVSPKWIYDQTLAIWGVMRNSIDEGYAKDKKLLGGICSGQDGLRLRNHVQSGKSVLGEPLGSAVSRAIAVMESNAAMNCVVASPTAGACGILAGTISALAEHYGYEDKTLCEALLVGGVVGMLIATRVPISGAMGGCQSEIGTASAMAAAAIVHLRGGSVEQVLQAVSIALKNMLGLICDPVAGPVEIPCIKRNAAGVANAFTSADMALAGTISIIPTDEVIDALINVQGLMHPDLRGNLKGGLASTKTALRLRKEWQQKLHSMQNT